MSVALVRLAFRRLTLALSSIALPYAASADAGELHFKSSLGDYRYSDGYAGQDVNLR